MIIIDDREVTQHPKLPEELGIPNRVERLEAGDFCFLGRGNESVGIERTEIKNLVQKLRIGELESQLYKCQECYSSVILLVEGVFDELSGLLAVHNKGNRGYYRNQVYPRTTYELIVAVLIRLSEMGIELIFSPNFSCSVRIVRLIYQQRTKEEEEHSLFKKIRKVNLPVKLTTNENVPKLMALVPRIPERVAIRLIYKFDSIWGVLHAEDKELLEVDGMGKGLVSNLKRSIGKP